MEDCNTLVSDCIVISCCCQCLILQLVVFIFVQLPRRVARKTKEYARRKLARRRRKTRGEKPSTDDRYSHTDEFMGFDNGLSMSMRILELEGTAINKLHRWGSCTDEVEKVLGELSNKGEFAFGSFWGENNEETVGLCSKCSRTVTKDDVLEFGGSHVVQFHFIEVVGPAFSPSYINTKSR